MPPPAPLDSGWFKWALLVLQCLLSALNQALCFSYAPVSRLAENYWDHKIHSSSLITIFFIVYIPFAFVGSWVLDKKGWRYGIAVGAFLQAAGALLRDVSSRVAMTFEQESALLIGGQILAAMAMPFMVNSPPVLSALWFPSSLRARVTSMGVHSNQLGVAIVYLAAPFCVTETDDIRQWNHGFAVAAVVLFGLSYACFCLPYQPLSPPDTSKSYNWQQWLSAFHHRGFALTVLVSAVAETAVNVLSTLLNHLVSPREGFSTVTEGIMGAAFILSSLVGGYVVSARVDVSGAHKAAVIVCCFISGGVLLSFDYILEASPADWRVAGAFVALVLVGFFVGPLQPIVLELGAECAYPTSEATVAALQQLSGNVISAILVPLLSWFQHQLEGNARAESDDDDDVSLGHASSWWMSLATPVGVVAMFLLFSGVAFGRYRGIRRRSLYETVPPIIGRAHLGM
ncbi:Major facilitator Superfamily [Achlya hypogyna]|uniref:Major facilitator Superfamily n=1 Tax=Achlya hypogyna TaxID=1202772 RepID=A0A1V9ZB90_ACHHY|nr:Major facilitator Superfamily [Achlya hypogyna]